MAGKKYREAAAQVEDGRVYSIDEAVELTKKVAFAKFDETVEVGMTLGVDPRKADQIVRGTVSLPKGIWRRSTRNHATGTALVPDTLTDLGGGACFNDARVQVASLPTA